MSKAHLVVGMTDTGKSTYIKNLLKTVPNKKSLLIYDINNEYSEFIEGKRILDFKEFALLASVVKNSIIVFEEATIFLDGRFKTDLLVQKVLTLKKHRKNYIFLVFHSLADVPGYVYRLSNYLTLFKTNDLSDITAKQLKDYRLKNYIEKLRQSSNIHEHITLKIL